MSPAVKKPRQLPMAAQIGVVLLALVIVAAAGYFLLVSPKKKGASDASAQTTQLQQELQAGTSAAQTAKAQSKIRVADVFRLTKAMPDSPDVGEIVLELSALAEKSGISFQSIEPQESVSGAGFQVQPMDVIFQGSFWELSDFLLRLRSLVLVRDQQLFATGRLFTVDKVNLREGQPSFPQISADLTIDAYVYGAAPAVAVPGAGTTTGSETTTTSTLPEGGSAASTSQPTETQGAGS